MKKGRTESGTLISQIHQVCGRIWFSILKRHGMEALSGGRGRVFLTGREAAFADRIQTASKEMNRIFYRSFTKKEIAEFEEQLNRILENCKAAEAEGNAH